MRGLRARRYTLSQEFRLRRLENEVATRAAQSPVRTVVSDAPWRRTATWRTWDGRGECPIPPETPVSIMLRNGDVEQVLAGDVAWMQGQGPDDAEPDDVVAYRVRSEIAPGGFNA